MSELDLLIDTLRRTDNSPNDFVDLRKGANAYSKFAEIYRQMSQSDTLNASDSNNSLEEAV